MARKKSFPDQLRAAVERAGWTPYRLAKETGIGQRVAYRFMYEGKGINLDRVDPILDALGLVLVDSKELKELRKLAREQKG